MGLSCSSSIKQPQTVSKARLVSMLTTPAFFIHWQEQVTFFLGAACLKQSAFCHPLQRSEQDCLEEAWLCSITIHWPCRKELTWPAQGFWQPFTFMYVKSSFTCVFNQLILRRERAPLPPAKGFGAQLPLLFLPIRWAHGRSSGHSWSASYLAEVESLCSSAR